MEKLTQTKIVNNEKDIEEFMEEIRVKWLKALGLEWLLTNEKEENNKGSL